MNLVHTKEQTLSVCKWALAFFLFSPIAQPICWDQSCSWIPWPMLLPGLHWISVFTLWGTNAQYINHITVADGTFSSGFQLSYPWTLAGLVFPAMIYTIYFGTFFGTFALIKAFSSAQNCKRNFWIGGIIGLTVLASFSGTISKQQQRYADFITETFQNSQEHKDAVAQNAAKLEAERERNED